MNINYNLSHSDFLAYQLYTSSKSKLHNKKRLRSRVIIPIFYILLALFNFYKKGTYTLGIGFIIIIIIAIIWFVFYPTYSKWRYKKLFNKHIKEHYKNRINKPIEISFNEDGVLNTKDFISESKISGTELKAFIETTEHVFIKLASDLSLVIPKHAIENLSELKKHIVGLGAEYVDELNWK